MPSKLMMAEDFIKALEANGLLPENTLSVTIRARYGDLLTMDYETIAETESMGKVIETLKIAGNQKDAIVH